jgi:acyl-CoA dehydrogenase
MTDQLLLDTAAKVFRDTCTFDAVQQCEGGGFPDKIWSAVAEVGLPWIGVAESAGGLGGELQDALEVLRVAGRYSPPIPLAETGILAGWLLAGAGLRVGEGPATVVPGHRRDTLRLDGTALSGTVLTGTAHGVAFARSAERIVALVESGTGWSVAVVPAGSVRVEPRANLAGEARDIVHFDAVKPEHLAPAGAGVDGDALLLRGALTRVMLMAGALEAMSALTVGYTNDRRQFGKPVASFQAVQQHLIIGAQESAIVNMAAHGAVRAAARSGANGDAAFEIAAAKMQASRAAFTATRVAHQAHGAMGMTQEYALHHLSRRLWAWRSEFGDDAYWSQRLGRQVAAAGADQLYPLITAGSALGVSAS